MARMVVLLRGINLASKNRVAMADLRELLGEMGYEDVRTLLQSGNVILSSSGSVEKTLGELETALAKRFGFPIDVMIRTEKELAAVVAANPLGDIAAEGKSYFVSFCADHPNVPDIDASDYDPERFAVIGREVYVWCAHGLRESKLMKALGEKKLGTRATVRNWNTVTKLHEMLKE